MKMKIKTLLMEPPGATKTCEFWVNQPNLDFFSCELRNCRKFPTKSKKFADALSKNTSITSLTYVSLSLCIFL